MRIAIPISDGRVSPVFDTARRVLLVDVDHGRESSRTTELLGKPELAPRVRRVAELEINVLICGAISRHLEGVLLSAGVEVVPQVCGPVEGILQAYVTGQLTEDVFLMPGSNGRRRTNRVGHPEVNPG